VEATVRDGKKRAVKIFMKKLGLLFLDYFQIHLEEAEAIGRDHEPLLKSVFDDINSLYVIELWYQLTNADEWADVWKTACWGRTNIEAFNAMFGKRVGDLPTEDIVEYMEAQKGKGGLEQDQIPKNFHKSQSWWFADFGKYS
jgi:hypothetical protein